MFTIEKALEIQKEQLLDWKGKLNSETYSKLEKFCEEENKKITTAKSVVRGDDLSIFIITL